MLFLLVLQFHVLSKYRWWKKFIQERKTFNFSKLDLQISSRAEIDWIYDKILKSSKWNYIFLLKPLLKYQHIYLILINSTFLQ